MTAVSFKGRSGRFPVANLRGSKMKTKDLIELKATVWEGEKGVSDVGADVSIFAERGVFDGDPKAVIVVPDMNDCPPSGTVWAYRMDPRPYQRDPVTGEIKIIEK
jgi:hypothetical protein